MIADKQNEATPALAGLTGSAPSPFDIWKAEIYARRVAIEDEWQTAEDWLDLQDYKEGDCFLERMICEAQKLRLHLKSEPAYRPNPALGPAHVKDIEFCENRGCAFNASGNCSSTFGQCYGYVPPNTRDVGRDESVATSQKNQPNKL